MDAIIQRISALSPCDFADALPVSQFIDPAISSLWQPVPKLVGRAYTVSCPDGDHLMFHTAIYRAKPVDVIVAVGDPTYALAGGNVCAIAQQNGIAGCVIDGRVRDLAEIRDMQFPVFAKGVIPKPGAKKQIGTLNTPVTCGGVTVEDGDYIIADEEGIAVIPQADILAALEKAEARAHKDASTPLPQWREQHKATVDKALQALGFETEE
ncbi:RraA family protein [Alteromonas facilis]|uniref:RraA family protein n=1 Tax=Alteromonas facilis TaxID=2048004 RepID=UPI000C29351B|nr:RraA family protein [Alteromonas facilis]